MGEVQALADFAVREPPGRQLGDLELLRCQLRPGLRDPSPWSFAGGAELAPRPLCVLQESERLERLRGFAQRRP